ncbi:MAG: glycosyltransferase family 2 protein [Deltaproteobacteria bacterium]|nr:MAG: glycosyltransferase family 2 protein [Deltaproteobacteria bacterium]
MEKSILSIVIPAYNEEGSLPSYLPEVVDHCSQKGYTLIIVNDGSKDTTLSICEAFSVQNSFIKVISHKVNRGYGGAIKSGVLAANSKYVITIDADGQHNLSDVDSLLEAISSADADMVVGDRGNKDASVYRGIGKRLIRSFARFLIPMKVRDINSGMKIYRTDLGQAYQHLCPNGMSYSDTILLVFINFRHLVLEKPITINKRISGTSTISTMTAFQTIKEIVNIVMLFNPLKIFIPLALLTFLAAVAWGIPIVLRGDGISVGTMLGVLTSMLFIAIGFIAEQIAQIRLGSIRQKNQAK